MLVSASVIPLLRARVCLVFPRPAVRAIFMKRLTPSQSSTATAIPARKNCQDTQNAMQR